MITTDRQLAANRQNALLSTGPTTPAGKAVSRWNALRHGLRAELVVLPDENLEDYGAFRQALVGELQPGGEMEAILADRIISTAWRLQRLGRVEAGLFFAYYDFCRVHSTIKTTPAVAAGLTDHVWSVEELLETIAATQS